MGLSEQSRRITFRWAERLRLRPPRQRSDRFGWWIASFAPGYANRVLGGAVGALAAIVLFVILADASPPSYPLPAEIHAEKSANPVSGLVDALSRCQALLSESERWRIAGVIHNESQRYGYDPLFVLAMIEVESTCSPTARGPRGAVGLVQIKPSTARAVAQEAGLRWDGVDALARPVVNVRLALQYLWQLERRFKDPYLAVAAYNLGPTRVARMPRHRARSTKYVRKILSRYENLLTVPVVGRS